MLPIINRTSDPLFLSVLIMVQVYWFHSLGVFSLCTWVLWLPGQLISLNTQRCWYVAAQDQVHNSWKLGVESG